MLYCNQCGHPFMNGEVITMAVPREPKRNFHEYCWEKWFNGHTYNVRPETRVYTRELSKTTPAPEC